jgi:hypothetical protein
VVKKRNWRYSPDAKFIRSHGLPPELISFGADYSEAGTSEASVVKKRNWRRSNKIPLLPLQGIWL